MFTPGGEQRITSKVANGLIEQGYDVTILIKAKEKINLELFRLSNKINIEFLDVNYNFKLNNIIFFDKLRTLNRKTGIFKFCPKIIRHFFCSNKLLKQLSNFFTENKFDYVVGVAGDRSFILSLLKSNLKGKLIFWNHQDINVHFKKRGSRYYQEDSFITPLFKNFDEVVVLTNDAKEKLDSYYDINCKVIANCNSFDALKKSSLNNKRFLAVGRLTCQKGFDYLLEAMSLFSKNNESWSLDIYGEGEDYNFLIKLIKKYNLQDRVNIFPYNKDMINIYPYYDIYLMTSRYEGFGLVTLEAMECGLPVIAFDISPNKDLILNEINGLLIPSYDVNEFSSAMLRVAENEELIKELANNLKLSTEKFSYKDFIIKWVELLNDLS